jgi:hypothetical protein
MLSRCVRSLAAPLAAMLFAACSVAPAPAPSTSSASSEIEIPTGTSCYDECAAARPRCPEECGASVEECAFATQTCFDSCDRGVGPWLPC